ncbi:MAG: hypothetical protein ABFC56_13655 [Clostridiaceae bacterium]
MNDIVLILIGVAMGLFGFLLLWELDNIAEQGGIGVRVIISLRKRIRELMDENAKLKAKLKPIETVDEWGKPDWVGKEMRK